MASTKDIPHHRGQAQSLNEKMFSMTYFERNIGGTLSQRICWSITPQQTALAVVMLTNTSTIASNEKM